MIFLLMILNEPIYLIHNLKISFLPKNKITTSKPKNTPENRLSDLENTLDLNIQILKTFYQSSKPVQSILTNENIINSIDNVKKKYLKNNIMKEEEHIILH